MNFNSALEVKLAYMDMAEKIWAEDRKLWEFQQKILRELGKRPAHIIQEQI